MLLLVTAAFAQQFDVASIKPVDAGGRESIEARPGSVTMHNVRLRAAIRWAYDVKEYQVAAPAWMGSPGWLGRDIARFDIAAKAPEGTPVAKLRTMMQALLAERFHVRLHRESREMTVFLLSAPKPKPVLSPAPEAQGPGRLSGNGGDLVLTGMSMAEFAEFLAGPLRVPVLDRTGLAGRFDFTISGKMMEGEEMISAVSAAIEDQLGLKLQRQKAPIEMVVVDRADQKPTEN